MIPIILIVYSIIGIVFFLIAHEKGHRDYGVPCEEPIERIIGGGLGFALAWPLILVTVVILALRHRRNHR